MSLQKIRAAIEVPLITAYSPVPVFVENQEYADNDATSEFVLVRVQWGSMTAPVIGCKPGEMIRGIVVLEQYTQKGVGPGRAQELITPAMQVLCGFGGLSDGVEAVSISNVEGPSFTQLANKPHLLTRVMGAWRAFYDGP